MDTKTPLTDREAGRVTTVLEQMRGQKLKLRELRGFTPEEIAKTHKLDPVAIARMAGRKALGE